MEFDRNVKPPKNIKIPEYKPNGLAEGKWILDRALQQGKDSKILVYYDPDIDGLMAGLLVEEYLNKLGLGVKCKNYRYYLNKDRAHGFKLTDEHLQQLKGYTIIAVDFSITKVEFDRILRAGINLINIDHHEINVSEYTKLNKDFIFSKCEDVYGVIINNQYKVEPSEFRFLSGAGMVYYFLNYISQYYGIPVDNDAPAMVGITLLSDIRELENEYARNFLKYTFSLDSSYMKFLQWLVTGESYTHQRFSPFGVPCITRDFIDFTFSPVINALLRANLGDEALNLLRGYDETIYSMRENDRLLSYRAIQKGIINDIMKELKEAENTPGSLTKNYGSLKVCCLKSDFTPQSCSKYNITNYIGVACSKIKDEDKTGAIFVIDKETNLVIRGSVRGGRDGVDYLGIFQHNGVPSAGHHNAFGILECDITKINFDKINADIERAENEYLLKHKNSRSVYEVENMGIFVKSPIFKDICRYNTLSRDNYRIYLKFTGDVEDTNRVKPDKVSDKFTRYIIDGTNIHCYDPSLVLKDALILPGLDNNKYVHFTLRPGFEYNAKEDSVEIVNKIASLKFDKLDKEELK